MVRQETTLRSATTMDNAPGGEGTRSPGRRAPGRRARRLALAATVGLLAGLTSHSASALEPPVVVDEGPEPISVTGTTLEGAGVDPGQLPALRAQGLAAGANQARAAIPGCTGQAPVGEAENGRVPAEWMCWLPNVPGGQLRADAAVAFTRLDAEYATAFGKGLCVGDTYRSYEYQVEVKERRGSFAAPAGTSNHGWGLAVDLCDELAVDTSPEWQWLDQNAARFGFANPDWARKDGTGPYEPWHWEFAAAVAEQKAKIAAQNPAPAPQPAPGRTRGSRG